MKGKEMKKILLITVILGTLMGNSNFVFGQTVQAAPRSAPFSRGVNFSAWFETNSAQAINFTKYIEQDFIDAKSMGVDVIRLPVRFHDMTSGAPDYIVDPLLFRFLDAAVDWAEKHRLYIIIDNHSFHPINPTPNDVDRILIPVWRQVAQRYRNRSDFVIYEILNEPHGISDALWGEIQGRTIDVIRSIDQRRTIIVGGTDYNSIGKLFALPRYADQNLIYTFHYYDPFIFTHQGATWGEPSLGDLAGVPFPYDRRRMPRVPASLRGTWVTGALNEYERSASPRVLNAPLDRVVVFAIERNVPVFCGEFGVFIPNSDVEDRVRWYEFVTNALDKRNISRTSWDYYGGFGIFNTGYASDFNYDVNVDVVKAMGFNPPEQRTRTQEPYSAGFTIYDDHVNRRYVTIEYWLDGMELSLYDSNAADGEFAIRWGNASQYNTINFYFNGNADFSRLVSEGYYLEFKARTQHPISFDVRFMNPESSTSTPWRMHYMINQSILPPDGRWHTIRIRLSDMQEHGAWINTTQQWLTPRGEFTWSNIRGLEFFAEYSDFKGQAIWLDSIRITR
jgi:endoglucanase